MGQLTNSWCHFSPSHPPPFVQWDNEKSGHCFRYKGYSWTQQRGLPLTQWVQLQSLLRAELANNRGQCWDLGRQPLHGGQAAHCGRLTTWDHFHHGRNRSLLSLAQTHSLGVDLPSLFTVLLPKPTAMGRQIISISVFHTALLLIKELILQQMEWNNEPLLMEFIGLTMFPIKSPQSRWPDILVGWPSKDALTMPEWQHFEPEILISGRWYTF